MFRYGKIIDSNPKATRSDRFEEMSKQQRLIEQKKQEIKAKFEERKRQETEEALKKLAAKANTDNKHKHYGSSRIQSWKSEEKKRKKSLSSEQDATCALNNTFSNDGSFLEQYKKAASLKDGKIEHGDNNKNNKVICSEISQVSVTDDNFQQRTYGSSNLHYPHQYSRDTAASEFPLPQNPTISNIPVITSVSFPSQVLKYTPSLPNIRDDSSIYRMDSTTTNSKPDVASPSGTVSETSASQSSVNMKTLAEQRKVIEPVTNITATVVESEHRQEQEHTIPVAKMPKMDNKAVEALNEMKSVAKIVAENGDQMESVLLNKCDDDEKLSFLRDKLSPPYIAFRHMVEKLRKENPPNSQGIIADYKDNMAGSSEITTLKHSVDNKNNSMVFSEVSASDKTEKNLGSNMSKVPADEDDSDPDSENKDERRKRKRKKRSRWAPEDAKVDLPPNMLVIPPDVLPTVPAVPTATSTFIGATVGMVTAPTSGIPTIDPTMTGASPVVGVAIPLQLGQYVPIGPSTQNPLGKFPGVPTAMISQLNRSDPALVQYALQAFGTLNLTDEDWKKAEDHYKINLLYQDMLRKREELEKLKEAGKFKYEYDSDEDTEGGTWEHKLRTQEMVATRLWADELTEKAKGKHHIGDFLPPDELERFMEKYDALKQGREPDLSDYKEFKLKEDNVGFQMLQKLGWTEGTGLGADGSGIVNPVNKAPSYVDTHGLGIEKPDSVAQGDDEYDAYRKRMMLAYRFRPNPLNNPRRPYY